MYTAPNVSKEEDSNDHSGKMYRNPCGTNQVTPCLTFCDFVVRWSGDSKIVEAFAEHDFSFAEAPSE